MSAFSFNTTYQPTGDQQKDAIAQIDIMQNRAVQANLAYQSSLDAETLMKQLGQINDELGALLAMRTLPMTQTILTGIAIGIFPLLVLAAVFNKLTLSVLKGYVFALMWLQSWPMLYAILNSAMTFYAKQNGAPVVLSEISQIQLKYSDLASTAGYLSMMIPPLSWMMVRGLGAGFSSVYSHFASSAISPTASAAGSVVDSAESQPDPAGCAGRNAGGAYFLPGQQLVAVPAGKNAGGRRRASEGDRENSRTPCLRR